MKSNELYLADIVERMRRVRESAASGRDLFFSSTEKQDAILHNLQLLGESVRRLSDELKSRHSKVPWREIAAFRNVVVHEYIRIDLDVVWEIVTERIPELERQIEQVVAETRQC